VLILLAMKFCIEIRERKFELDQAPGGGSSYQITELIDGKRGSHCGQIVPSQTGWLAFSGKHSGLSKSDLESMLALIPPKPWPGNQYYLTHDRRLLIRAKIPSYAIWEVGNYGRSYFYYEGKNWGLDLVAGRNVTQDETDEAGMWMKEQITGER
jgi:hypothetical protein